MKLEKILEALSGVDELGHNLKAGCAIAQLFYASGKKPKEIAREMAGPDYDYIYCNMFDGLLRKDFGMSEQDENKMFYFNDTCSKNRLERHKKVVAHYEALLIEELIASSVEVEKVLVKV